MNSSPLRTFITYDVILMIFKYYFGFYNVNSVLLTNVIRALAS